MSNRKTCPSERHKPCTVKAKGSRYSLMGRIWVEGKSETFLGHGRAVLLERIQQYGSITRAAQSLNMSYRRAWDLVESMNSQARTPLVEKAAGGKGGGGAGLTDAGARVLRSFRKFHNNFQRFLAEQARDIAFD
ncbi:MAG TPA: LysR family transcriptional regulator [Dissulfurispiraceae bacterium]